MGPSITIRKGILSDLTVLQNLFVNTVSSVCSEDYNPQQIRVWTSGVEDKDRWLKIISHQFVLVAQLKNKIVGFATLENSNHIDLIYVHKNHQRQGIAIKLYSEIEDMAKQKGQTELTSDVSKTAKPFFEKIGFHI